MDYSKMKATKVSKKKYDGDFEISRSSANKAKKSISKAGVSIIVIIIFLIIGVAGGFLVARYAFPNDTFEMVASASGSTDIYIGGEDGESNYTELGVKCVAFGKDISNECTVTYYYRADLTEDAVQVEGVDESTEGMYYAVYTCPNIKYSSVKLIRNIIVLGEEV